MRVLLANSYFLASDPNEQRIMKPYPPLGILYLAATLKAAGNEVSVFDGTFAQTRDFGPTLASARPDLIGIYGNIITRESALAMTRTAAATGVPVILGGPDPTGDGQAYLDAGAAAVVCGEGERTFAELVAHYAEGGETDLVRVAGLMLPGDRAGTHRKTAEREQIDDLDTIPLPDRSVIDMPRYLEAWKERHGYTSVSLITSRGCPYQCAWCSKEIFGNRFRQRGVDDVLEEVRLLLETYRPDQLWFADDVLSLDKAWTLELSARMVDEGLTVPFECLSRVDRADEQIIAALKRAGCFRIWYGAESGSERVVARMNKGIHPDRVHEVARMTMDAGVEAGLFILVGYPGERIGDLWMTLKMIRQLRPHHCGGSVAFPIKGTPFYDEVKHLLAEDYSWSRRNENRMSFKGRYPPLFYWFAVRLLHNWGLFHSVRTRRDGLGPQLLRGAKVIVAGSGTLATGVFSDLRQRLSRRAGPDEP